MAEAKKENNVKTIIVSTILAIIAGAFGIKYAQPTRTNNTSIKTIKFAQTKYTIEKGESKNAVVVISPQNSKGKISCKSMDADIVKTKTSNNTCIITGVKKGTTKVVAYYTYKNSKKKATTTVTVNSKTKTKTSVTSIKFNQKSYTIQKKQTKNIEVIISPKSATNKAILCKTSDKNTIQVKTQNNTCIVTGLKKGTAKLIATSKDNNKSAEVKITVK